MAKFIVDIHGGYYVPVTIYVSGTLSTGVKKPVFIAPEAMTIVKMVGICDSGTGTGCTYRPSKNKGSSDGTTSAATLTSPVTTSQSLSLAAGDRLGLNVVSAGTNAADLSVTFWARVE